MCACLIQEWFLGNVVQESAELFHISGTLLFFVEHVHHLFSGDDTPQRTIVSENRTEMDLRVPMRLLIAAGELFFHPEEDAILATWKVIEIPEENPAHAMVIIVHQAYKIFNVNAGRWPLLSQLLYELLVTQKRRPLY